MKCYWDNQIKHISSKVSNGLRMLYIAWKLTDNQETLKTIYSSLVQPYFDYCDVVWAGWLLQNTCWHIAKVEK